MRSEPPAPAVAARQDAAATPEDEPVVIPVLANDAGEEPLTVERVTQPAEGEADQDGHEVTYTPDSAFTGCDEFTYVLRDSAGAAATGTVCVTVFPDRGGAVRVIATDYPNLQAAVDALPDRTGEVYIPRGDYVLTSALDLTSASTGCLEGLTLAGAGRATRLVAQTAGQPVLDLTGASRCIIRDLRIDANAGPYPNVGILLARNAGGEPAGDHRFVNLLFEGQFTVANVYSLGSTGNRFFGCLFINTAPSAHNVVWSPDNVAGVTSPYRGAPASPCENRDLRMIGCTFYNWGDCTSALGCNVYLRGPSCGASIRDAYMGPGTGGYDVYIQSTTSGVVRTAEFCSIRVEDDNGSDVFRIEGAAENIGIRHSTLLYGEARAVRADSVTNLVFENNDVWNIRGWKLAIQADHLADSRISDNIYTFHNWGGTNPEPGPEKIARGTTVTRSYIQASGRDQVVFTNTVGTVVDAVNEDGVRRRHLGTAGSGERLNLTPVDTSEFSGMKRGDVVLDNGAHTASGRPGLAVYDGAKWVFMN